MKPYFETKLGKLYHGDALTVLSDISANFVQMCVTSPPYWGLRDYGVDGQLGLESTPEEYVEKIVEIFRKVKRVLKKDGTLWLNLGDSYGGDKSGGRNDTDKMYPGSPDGLRSIKRLQIKSGLKPKDLVGIPWRVAFALQADGWYLRSDIIWHKPNPMPEGVQDRCTNAHEYIFLLSKSNKYYYDTDAIKENSTTNESRPNGIVRDRIYDYNSKQKVLRSQWNSFKRNNSSRPKDLNPGNKQNCHRKNRKEDTWDINYRNKRSVWTVATKPYKAHFATFPPDLIVPCVKAGSKESDVILDPFSGVATSAYVAERLNRKWIGIEISEEYCEIAAKRLDNLKFGLEQVKKGKRKEGLLY